MTSRLVRIVIAALSMCAVNAFVTPSAFGRTSSLKMSDGMEQIEFKIFPDGRVEETVRGIKGNNCHKVTEGINEALGEVIATKATEEMYEQELVVDNTIYENEQDSSGPDSSWSSSSSSW